MKREVFAVPLLFLALLAACAAADAAAPARPASAGTSADTPENENESESESDGAPAVQDADLAILGSPSFRRRFLESYIAATDVEPQLSDDERAVLYEVLPLITRDELDEAQRLLEEQRTAPGASAVFDFTLGNVHFQRDELDLAAVAYRTAVDKYPRFRRAWENLGQLHFKRSDFAGAAAAFARVVALGGGDAVTYGLLGIAHARLGDHLAAESAFRMAVMMDPDTTDWQLGLAQSLFGQRRFADAVALFDGLLAAHPDRADWWLVQGEALAMLDRPLEAAENFEMADQLGGATVQSLDNLGDIYAREGLHDVAVDCYLRALELSDEASPDRALRAARHLGAHGALDETRRLVEGIAAACGDRLSVDERKELLRLRARLAVAAGAGGEEARVLQEIVELDPLDGDALILLGQHSARTGDPDQAVLYYERAAALEPFEADAKVRHAELLVRQGRYADAVPLLRRAQVLEPRDHVQKYLEQVERIAQPAR